jgi:hypothetical protein
MLTIENWLRGIGLKRPIEECPAWPPDLFALAGTLIRRSGAYLRAFERHSCPCRDDIVKVAARWRHSIDGIDAGCMTLAELQPVCIDEVRNGWRILIDAKETPVGEINRSVELSEELLRLTLLADEASAGIGISRHLPKPGNSDRCKFLFLAAMALLNNRQRSFCWEVPRDVLCVLGKQHTPQKGTTFRSLSHHLALYQPSEIEARWYNLFPESGEQAPSRKALNLLLLPWPMRVETDAFREVRSTGAQDEGGPRPGYFRYRPNERDAVALFSDRLTRALTSAQKQAGTIDAIVFPELALTKDQYDVAEAIAVQSKCILICGLRHTGETFQDWDANFCVLQPAGAIRGCEKTSDAGGRMLVENLRLVQAKHHRWYLDRGQIVSYQLGGRLPTSRGYWEYIKISDRVLYFATLNGMTWTVLVCEDLARQDPAAGLIRAVGPNLLITLLMDGPQLSQRWPARYASVLADDPGTSVLTLTSLGMAERSRPILESGMRARPNRVIALWRDAVQGEIQIALDPGDDACVLSLECRSQTEYCAAGSNRTRQSCYPIFAGYRSIQTAPVESWNGQSETTTAFERTWS